jgi:hypothetical protein
MARAVRVCDVAEVKRADGRKTIVDHPIVFDSGD